MNRRNLIPPFLALAAALFWLPGTALAHEGDIDLAFLHLSQLTAYILGGSVGGLLMLGFGGWALANWSLKKQEAKKERRSGQVGPR